MPTLPPSPSPVTAAEERAGRRLQAPELSGAGRVGALGDEGMQVCHVQRFLGLLLQSGVRLQSLLQ